MGLGELLGALHRRQDNKDRARAFIGADGPASAAEFFRGPQGALPDPFAEQVARAGWRLEAGQVGQQRMAALFRETMVITDPSEVAR